MTPGQWNQVTWIARTRRSRVGHARDTAQGGVALLKVCTGDGVEFRDEYELLHRLDVPGLLHPTVLSTAGALPAMVCPDLDVVGLTERLVAGPLLTRRCSLPSAHWSR